MLRIALELLTELQDEVVDRARGAVVVLAPHPGLDLLARQDAVARADQEIEDVELGRRELDGLVRPKHLARRRIDREIADDDAFDLGRGDGAASAEDGLHAGQELREAEGLGHVVFCAELEAHDLVHLGAACREHDHGRRVFAGAQRAEHLEAVHLRQHHVEDDEVERAAHRLREPVLPVVREIDAVAFGGEVHLEPHGDALVVLDHQDATRGRGSSHFVLGNTRVNVEPLPIALSIST